MHFISSPVLRVNPVTLALQMQPFDSQQTMWVSPNGQPVLMYNGGQVLQRAHALSWLLSIARAAGKCVCHALCRCTTCKARLRVLLGAAPSQQPPLQTRLQQPRRPPTDLHFPATAPRLLPH